LIGMRKKAPMWVQTAGLEWLFRLCLEPKRLFRRYMVTNSFFIFLMTRELIRVKLFKKQPIPF
jgi:N-acetylglucosaminyldiphosphoundecaprenol N-acetyl-beta-D-mannosaminyltransferase